MKIGLIAGVAGLAASAAALANPWYADFRDMGENNAPVERPRAGQVQGEQVNGTAIDLGSVLTVSRASSGERGALLTCSDNCENLQLFPTPLNNQVGNPVWSDGSITGLNRWRGQTGAVAITFAVNDPIGGNNTVKIRQQTTAAQAPDGFFTGTRYDWLRTNSPLVRVGFEPDAGQPCQMEHDMFLESIASVNTSEPIYSTSGFITSRILWGGTNATPDIGLPVGDLTGVYVLGFNPSSFLTGIFRTCQWEGPQAPNGQTVGQDVVMQVGAWLRVRHQTNADGSVAHYLNYNDGTGYHLIYTEPFITGVRMDTWGSNSSYEVANDPVYFDNVSISGVEVVLPSPPTELECGPSGYSDDSQWLNAGPLKDQNIVWFDALSSRANVDVVSGDQIIRQTNIFSDDEYREEYTRALPTTFATPGNPWTLCEETRMNGGLIAQNRTVRGFAPWSFAVTGPFPSQFAGSPVTRLAFGHYDPNRTPAYVGRVFIQHDVTYHPIDDEDTANPFLPGESGFGGLPVIGGAATIGDMNFDYYDTGVSLAPNNTARTYCIEVAEDLSMTVTYGTTVLVGGTSGVVLPAFASSLDELRHESENQIDGNSNNLFTDDIVLTCTALPLVNPPALNLVYLDNIEAYNLNVPIGFNDDDGDPLTSFRWSSADDMFVVDFDLEGGENQVLRMENVFHDTEQVQGDFTLFTQASTQLPNVTASSSRGYAAGGDMRLTDGLTTRAWAVAEVSQIPTVFNVNTEILFSSGTGTFWVLQPDTVDPINNDPIWVDTGTSLAALGVNFNQWFRLTIHRNLDGTFIFKVNAKVLRDSGGAIVRTNPLQSTDGGIHENLDRLFYLGGDDIGVPAGSILYTDNVTAWALPCRGDTNDDGQVVFADINNILGSFNQNVAAGMPPNVGPDANGDGVADDGVVNFADLNDALGQFNNPCD